MNKMKIRTILFWLGAFMASIGFWMLFSAVTGYPCREHLGSWILSSILCGLLTGLFLISLNYMIGSKLASH